MIETLEDVYAEALRIARAHRLTRGLDPRDQDDIAHEAVTNYLGAFPGRKYPKNAAAWLEVAIRNEATDFLRGRQRRRVHEEPLVQDTGDGIEDLLASARSVMTPSLAPVQRDLLDRLLALLAPGAATVLRLRFIDGSDATEVAERLGIGRAAVDQRVARAKRMLRDALDGHPDLVAELRKPHPRPY